MAHDEILALTCPKCHRATPRSVRWVQENTFFTCSHCGNSTLIDKDAAMTALAAQQRRDE
jgi:RNase P subunit RPR2